MTTIGILYSASLLVSLFADGFPLHEQKMGGREVGGREGGREGGRGGNVSTWKRLTHVQSKIGAMHPKITSHPPHSSSNNQPAPMQHRIHTAGGPWQPWRAQGAIHSRVGGARVFCEKKGNEFKTGTRAERGTPRGPSRPTSKHASTNSLARSLTVSTGENK